MKIIRLQSENFKRLKAVDITPGEDGIVTIRGKNAQGKSSVLDSVFAALGGLAAAPPQPVRKGQERAVIKLDLGQVTVLRTFDADGTTSLKVETTDGAKYSKPQSMLDDLVGRISFDPLEFARMPAKEQAAQLRRLVPLSVDLDALAQADRDDFAARRDINRDAAALLARIEAIPVIEGLPDKAPDRSELTDKLAKFAESNSQIERDRLSREEQRRTIEARRDQVIADREEVKRLREKADELEAGIAQLEAGTAEREAELEALPELPILADIDALRDQISKADRMMHLCAERDTRARLEAEHRAEVERAKALTDAMDARAAERAKALAEAPMPVPGMTLNDEGDMVMLDGVPFEQASDAQQLRVSTTLAMQANPKLRVLRIKQGSLLDEDGLQLLADMAKAGQFQIWLEVVGEGGQGIIMEDGAVRGAAEPESLADEGPKRRAPKSEAVTQDESKPQADPAKLDGTLL